MNTRTRPLRRQGGLGVLVALVALGHLELVGLVQAHTQPTREAAAMSVRLIERAPEPPVVAPPAPPSASADASLPSPAAATAVPAPAAPRLGPPGSHPVAGPAPLEPLHPAWSIQALGEPSPAGPATPAVNLSESAAEAVEAGPLDPTPTPTPTPTPASPDIPSAPAAWMLAAAEPRPVRPERRQALPAIPAARAEPPPPVKIPAPITLRYSVRRGPLAGEGELVWQHDGQRYSLDLVARMPLLGTIYEQHSRGQFDEAGVAPLRYTEKRLTKSERAVNFVRPDDGSPGQVAYSARSTRSPLVVGTQDRLSWMAQLAARLAARPGELAIGQRIDLPVAGPSGDLQQWQFVVKDHSSGGEDRVWRLLREADQPFETQAEVWVDVRRGLFPVRVRLTEANGDPLDLRVK